VCAPVLAAVLVVVDDFGVIGVTVVVCAKWHHAYASHLHKRAMRKKNTRKNK
jgi:hypothetical protein